MSSILLNSESKLSQCINNNNSETDNLSEDGLFNSLFGIISQESTENIKLEKILQPIKKFFFLIVLI